MAPIMISNQRPGFVPFSARSLAIMGRASRPQSPTFKPASFQPISPAIQGRVILGQTGTDALASISDFDDVPLNRLLSLIKTADVNALVQKLGLNKGLDLVAALLKKSGTEVTAALDRTWDKYRNVPQQSLGAWAIALTTALPAPGALYTYLMGSYQNRAVAELESIRHIGDEWINKAHETWFDTGWLAEYDEIDISSSNDVQQVYDWTVIARNRVSNLSVNISALPESVILNSVKIFWSHLWDTMVAVAQAIVDILSALGELARALGKTIAAAARAAGDFPYVALAVLGLGGILLWKLA